MAASIFHRGPDSGGKFQLPHLALAIRRLSIIDLETGNQPLSNETGEITLVFNGEIYNYRELCQGLLDRGHHFKTHSDGEAIIHLYEEQGPDCLRELNGMFAIALWDDRAKRLLLARDRAGEKPLYYWRSDQTLVFGSEIRSLLDTRDQPRDRPHRPYPVFLLWPLSQPAQRLCRHQEASGGAPHGGGGRQY